MTYLPLKSSDRLAATPPRRLVKIASSRVVARPALLAVTPIRVTTQQEVVPANSVSPVGSTSDRVEKMHHEEEHDEQEPLQAELDEDLDPADVFFRTDITCSVAVAAFGGVQMNLDGAEQISVHPAFLWFFCIPLLCAQFSLAFAVGLNIDLDDPIVHHEQDVEMETSLKVLLVVICQLTFFDRMLSTLRLLLFCINPASWTDIKRIDSKVQKSHQSRCWWVHSAGVLFIFPLSTMVLKICLQYYINVQSISVILGSEDLNDAVFDSLAIFFILDLDEVVWNFAKTILHLDDFDSFVFELWRKERRDQAIRNSCFRPILRFKVLHRGTGARRLENFLSFLVMFVVYLRMLMNILFAFSTNVIPATRDACIQWVWITEGSPDSPIQAAIFTYGINFLLLPYRPWWKPIDELKKRAEVVCTEEQHEHLETSQGHWLELACKYPALTASVCTILVGFLFVPELFLEKGRLRETLLRWDGASVADSRATKRAITPPVVEMFEASSRGTTKRLDRLRRDVGDLRAENESLRDQVRHLTKRLSRAGL